MENKKNLCIKGIDPDVYRQFKALSVLEGKNIGDKLNEVMLDELNKSKGITI